MELRQTAYEEMLSTIDNAMTIRGAIDNPDRVCNALANFVRFLDQAQRAELTEQAQRATAMRQPDSNYAKVRETAWEACAAGTSLTLRLEYRRLVPADDSLPPMVPAWPDCYGEGRSNVRFVKIQFSNDALDNPRTDNNGSQLKLEDAVYAAARSRSLRGNRPPSRCDDQSWRRLAVRAGQRRWHPA